MRATHSRLSATFRVLAAVSVASLTACGGNDNATATPSAGPTAAEACTTLSGKTIAGATLSAVAVAPSGATPTYCKVNGTLAPKLNFEIRLPDAWNGKLYYGGGGGYDGSIFGPGLGDVANVAALNKGYATVASDSGHQGSPADASFALTDTVAAQLFGSLSVPTVMSTAIETVTAAYGHV